MPSISSAVLKISGKRPRMFAGSLVLPASKSYLHRALFISSLTKGESSIINCGPRLAADVKATIALLRAFGVKITYERSLGTIRVSSGSKFHPAGRQVFVGGSGTTARLGVSLACLAKGPGSTTIVGDNSLSKRPMEPLLYALSQLGADCQSRNGYLPLTAQAGGIKGGECDIDGSISSQFISSLLIACTKASKNTVIRIRNPSRIVSEPYIEATLRVLRSFGFKISVSYTGKRRYREFRIPADQVGRTGKLGVPGDMSSAAVIIGATLCASGKVELKGVDLTLPQSDSVIIDVAKRFGAAIERNSKKGSLVVASERVILDKTRLDIDLRDSPDVVPAVVGMAMGLNRNVRIRNVAHLRFKESNRLRTLTHGFQRLGLNVLEGENSIETLAGISKLRRKPIVLDPQDDHRMLMAFTIAGLSGRLGAFEILDPGCVRKSYPDFVSDLQRLCGDEGKRILRVTQH